MNSVADNLIRIAKQDLFSSEVLYKKGLHPQSYFYFQQATEKANKAFGLIGEIISEEELPKIQHNQLKIFRKGLDKHEKEIAELVKIGEKYPNLGQHDFFNEYKFHDYHKDLQAGQRFHDTIGNLDLVNIPLNDLYYFLDSLYDFEESIINLPKNFQEVFKKKMATVTDWVGNIGTPKAIEAKREMEAEFNKEENIKLIAKFLPAYFRRMKDLMFINYTLYYCALITIQHSSLARYPIDEKNPLKIYNKRLPVVKKQSEFMELLLKAIKKLKKFNK